MNDIRYIYKITNLVNQKVYIGCAKSISKRYYQHIYAAKDGKTRLSIAIREFGASNFKVEKIKTCFTLEHAEFSERYFINLYSARDDKFGYNTMDGGFANGNTIQYGNRRGQYISTSELDEKIFALIAKDPALSESEIVKQALYKHLKLTRTLKKLTHDPTRKK